MVGKKFLIVGAANERSLAWGIAQELHKKGAELAFTYLNETLEKRVRPLAESVGAKWIGPCNVEKDDEILTAFSSLSKVWPDGFHGLVHSVAFAEREDLEGRLVDTSRKGFAKSLDISAYSLIALCKQSEPFFEKVGGGSVVTLSYLGAERVVQNYNVMGVSKAALEACVRYLASDLGPKKIRVNAISAGPVKTLAAAGIRDLRSILAKIEEKAPLKENITQEDVGHLARFLLSDDSKHMTGSTLHVDSGFHSIAY